MVKKSLLIMMLLALFAPWAANAQETLTVCDGTAPGTTTSTNDYIPVYGYMADTKDYTSEFIIPSADLASINGMDITKLTFYLSTPAAEAWTATFKVYMKEVENTTITSMTGPNTSTVVYTGTLDGSNATMVVNFDDNYTYNGGNLLIGTTITVKGNWKSATFSGISAPNGSSAYASSPTSNYPTKQSFLPKTTINYEQPSTCKKPTLAEAVLTQGNGTIASLSWTENGEAEGWTLQYGTDNTFANCTELTSGFTIEGTTVTANLTGLTPEQKLYARVKPDCDTDGTKWSNEIEFKPTNAIPQTVCDGTTTNSYIPVYGNYAENYNKDEFIIPATTEGMATMASGTIKGMTFYLSSPASDLWGAALYRVFMKEVNESSFASTSYYGTDGATIVYEGALDGTQSTMTIEFTTDYEYNGGNLLVGIYEYNKGSFKSCSFYGITSTNGSMYKNNSTSLESITSGNLQNFIPKTTFIYLPSNTPKPRNIQVSDITASQATVSWEAPATGTPTGYEYQIKVSGEEWPTSWINAENNLSVEPTGLTASTDYVVRVRAVYAEGASGSIETEFRTLDACAFPTNFTATTVPGVGTDANFSWVKGYDETAWVLQIATDADFTTGVVDFAEGFVVEGNNVTYTATGLTPEQTYYAHVKANCDGPTSAWSDVAEFTPTNYVDYTFGNNATSTTSYVPFYGSYANYGTLSQFIITASNLAEVSGGIIRRMTFHTSTASASWGDAVFDVYVKEVEATSFNAANANALEDWTSMTNVYSGSLSVSGSQMVINFTEPFSYNGGNLMIGFNETTLGTGASVSWYYVSGQSNAALYGYKAYSYSSYSYEWSYSRTSNIPKITFNYQPTPYKYPVIDEDNCTFETTSAHIAWTVTGATPTGYQYQYKPASATEWPSAWTSVTTAYADLSDLTPGSFYDFRVKALYDGGNESVVVDYSFVTECAAITDFPWKETFESYPANTNTAYDETYKFDHPCWVNEHLVDGTGSSGSMTLFQVCSALQNGNSTHKLQLPDMKAGTVTGLRLPEMTLASGTDYQFVLDINRNTNSKPTEGIRVFVSTNGELEGATELCFISRDYTVASAPYIPAEGASGWYTYELPLGIQGTCYIILRGESQYGSATYMDNLIVEEIPTCARPSELASSNVTNHSATIEWTAGDTEQTLWQIAYSKTNFDPNTANFDITTVSTIDATAHPFTLDKILDAASTYYVYVRANCGTTAEPDFGPWSRKGINFTTLAATPAPSNFTASNIGSQTADLVWTAGGGDYELSWDLYYVQSDDAPTAPTEETHATKTVTTLPTTENPYTLDGLREESRYYIWVRANHTINSVTTHSAWVALTGNFFTTLVACPTPTGLAYNNLTAVSADLSWVGSPDVTDYTVQYRTSAGMSTTVLSEHFDVSGVPTGWTKYTGLVDEVIDGAVTLSSTTSGWNTNTYALGTYNMKVNVYGSSCKYWLVTPEIELGTGNVLNFDLALTDYGNANVIEYPTQQPDDRFVVLVYADDAWHILREWNNSGSEYVYNTIATAGENVTIALSLYSGKTVKIAFYGESTVAGASSGVDDNDLHIDNVEVGTPTDAGEWITAVDDVETQSYQLTGLTGGVKYDVHVKSNCTSGEYCEPISFTTLAAGNMVFTNATNDGKWGNSGNWAPAQLPVPTDEVILRANATIENGCVAEAKKITFSGTPTPTLTIADGGQLITNTAVTATVQKVINAHGTTVEEGGWNFIALPLYNSNLNPTSAGLITDNLGSNVTPTTATYDLYKFNQNPTIEEGIGNEWINYRKAIASGSSFYLVTGNGYLYANAATVTLNFTGNIRASQEGAVFGLIYSDENPDANMHGWNLMGNPYTFNAYVNKSYYKMNENGSAIEPVDAYQTTTIAPCTGIMVQATETGQSITFSKDAPSAQNGKGNLSVALAQANVRNNTVMDKAVLSFNEGSQLGKFYFGENAANIYFPQDNKEFAIVSSEGQGEMPLNFRANENGSYTLSFNAEEVSFSYLHLIDNMTGTDVDLLQAPSYTFNATTTDYTSRFKLVFCTGVNNDSDNFAFYSNGNWIIGNEGEATLQVVDVTGRILSSETVNGSVSKAINAAPGVYMIRLINGENVKVQKIVVR